MAPDSRLEETRLVRPGRPKGIISSRQSGSRIHAQSYEPPTELAQLVERFWIGAWNLPPDAPHTSQLLSDPSVHLVFERGPQGDESRLVGVWTELWQRTLKGCGEVRGVKLQPGAASAVTPAPIKQWTDRITPLSELFPKEHQGLTAAVLDPKDPAQGFEALARFLAPRATPGEDARLARQMVDYIRGDSSVTRVDSVAKRFALHLRLVQRLFRDHVGASPKWLIRRYRLQEVATRIENGTTESLATLANRLGYSDQAHLARDFRAATGKTPTEFERQE